MRILLIGGNGFIGVPLARRLRESGHAVAIFHRSADPGSSVAEFERIQGDRNRLSAYRPQLQQFSPDVVIDLIVSSGEQACGLMKTLRDIAPRVVALSSMDVYRAWGVLHGAEPCPLEPLPLTEDSRLPTVRTVYPPQTIKMLQSIFTWLDDHYDKIAVEEAIMSDPALSGTAIRLPMMYGPGDPLHRFFPLLKRCEDGRPSVLLADDMAAWRAPRGYVEKRCTRHCARRDLGSGAWLYLQHLRRAHLIRTGLAVANRKEYELAGKVRRPAQDKTPKHLLQPGNAQQHIVATSERIRSELCYKEPVEIDEAIRRTIAWEQQNPPRAVILHQYQFDYDAEDAALANAT
jgi:nucleoside-diphosphate-sugar epimerase